MSTALLTALLFVLPLVPQAVAEAAAAPADEAPRPRVVVLQAAGQPDQSGFVEALRIQLAGTGLVFAGAPLDGGPLTARVAAAGEAARSAHAILAVWVERAPAPGGEEVVLYVVGDADGRAVVQVFRLPEGSPADTDRALALKVGSVVDEMLAPAAQVVLAPDSEVAKEARAITAELAPRAQGRVHFVFGVETRVTTADGGDRGVAGEAGAVVGASRRRLMFMGEVRVGSGDRWSNAAGEVRTTELTCALGYRQHVDIVGFDVRMGLGLHIVAADGTSAAGGEGSGLATQAFVAGAIERRFSVGDTFLIVGLGAELAPATHAFELNHQPVAQTAGKRGFLSLSWLWRGP